MAFCLLSRRTSGTRFAESLAIHDSLLGGGRSDCWSKLLYCTNSTASAEVRDPPADIVAATVSPFVVGRTSGRDTRRT
jgi:hypothetical protein